MTEPAERSDAAAPSRSLTREQLARQSGATPAYIGQLVAIGAIRPDSDDVHPVEDIPHVRLAVALAAGGVDLDGLAWAIGNNILQLDRIAGLWTIPDPTGRTFADFAQTLGEAAANLPAIYAALGLVVPPPELVIRRDEEEVVARFVKLWGLVDGRIEVFVRAARIAGEGVRRIRTATLDLFDEFEGSPPDRLRRGLSLDAAIEPSMLMGAVMGPLLAWLDGRHAEHEIFGRIVHHVQESLARAGHSAAPSATPAAIAFVDLAGYTTLTQEAGDEQAAQFAATLHAHAEQAVRLHGGSVVKLLGDGVMLRHPSTAVAIRSVRELMLSLPGAGLPPAHAGIAAGPIVVRDGDVYGHTVNLAARIAAEAVAGELLLRGDTPEGPDGSGVRVEAVGRVALKGVSEPVALWRVLLD